MIVARMIAEIVQWIFLFALLRVVNNHEDELDAIRSWEFFKRINECLDKKEGGTE